MNPRQRRGVLLLMLAVVGAVAVLVGLASYVANVQAQLGPMVSQVRLTEDVAYLEQVTSDMVEVVEVPERWNSDRTITTPAAVVGKVAAAPLYAGAVLQESSIQDPPAITPGQREVAILVDPETGVGGKIQAGDVVDIYATYQGSSNEHVGGDADQPPRAEVVLEGVRIVAVAPGIDTEAEAQGDTTAVPVTFALEAQEALRLTYAESFAEELRLGLRVRTDEKPLSDADKTYSE